MEGRDVQGSGQGMATGLGAGLNADTVFQNFVDAEKIDGVVGIGDFGDITGQAGDGIR